MAMLPKWPLSPIAPPAPALRVVVHKRVTQWRRQPCPYQKMQARPMPPLGPPQSMGETCSHRDSETRRSVPE
eukprot:1574654-Pleurochrysis_carterae.AAC.1